MLIWTGLFTSLGPPATIHSCQKLTRVNLISIALGCSLNILLNFALIPNYGAMGAVVATFISYWFAVHGTCFFFKVSSQNRLDAHQSNVLPEVLVITCFSIPWLKVPHQ